MQMLQMFQMFQMFQMLLLLRLVSQHASGVDVYEGAESVLLSCQVPVSVSRSSTAAVWDRDEFKIPTVHMHLQSGDDLTRQNPRYRGRTSLRADALQTGDLSLTLGNPTVSDSGTYTCIVRKYGQDQNRTEVQLKVKELPPVWPKVLLPVLVLVILLILVVLGVLKYQANQRRKRSEALQAEMVEVTSWVETAQLPFKTTAQLSDDVTVEWKYKDQIIFSYPSGQNRALLQDQDYKDRTEMNKNPLRSGDLSLILKKPLLTDHGVYTCTVYNKGGKILRQKVVALSVRDRQVEMVEVADWEKSVLLPFKTTSDLRQNVTVEWRRSDSKQVTVHMYPCNQHQEDHQDPGYRGRTDMNDQPQASGDFSLTLKDLQLSDQGVYTCTIYNKDGKILLQKVVTLSIRVSQLEVVVLTEGEEATQLPFKITDDLPQDIEVEWRHQNMKVHVFPNDQQQQEKQHPDYRGRTEMTRERVEIGDLSLTLKNPTLHDCGVYTCTVKKDGKILRDKIVAVGVQGSLKKGTTDVDYIIKHVGMFPSRLQASSTE